MTDEPVLRNRTIRVLDREDDAQITSARIVFLSGLHGRTTARTGNDATTNLWVHDGLQLMGVSAPGYRPQIISIQLGNAEMQPVRLSRLGSDDRPQRKPARGDVSIYREATKRLLSQVTPPLQNDPPHRARIYYSAMAFADFESTLATVKFLGGRKVANNATLGSALLNMDWLTPEQIQMSISLADENSRLHLALMQARGTDDENKRLEYLGEAIVLASQQSGDDHLYAVSAVADALLVADEFKVARNLLEETYRMHPELSEALNAGTQKKMIGVARYFTPLYALIDYDAAIRLIELTASNGETDAIKAKAQIYVAAHDPGRWRTIRKRDSIDSISSDAIQWFRMRFPWSDFDSGASVIEQIDDGRKLVMWVQLMESSLKHADGRTVTAETRLRSIRAALPMIEPSRYEYGTAHASIQAVKLAKLAADLDPDLAEQFLFEAIWNRDLGPTAVPMKDPAQLAGELAGYDVDLARDLVSPALGDWSFLFGQQDNSSLFQDNTIIAAAARIDPDWAISLCRDLGDRHFGDESARKYETVKSIVDAWIAESVR